MAAPGHRVALRTHAPLRTPGRFRELDNGGDGQILSIVDGEVAWADPVVVEIPPDAVSSVNGQTGAVVVTAASLGAASTADVAGEAALARNANNLMSGTVADARIPATITRGTELAAAIAGLSTVYQPLDPDLTTLAAAGNSAALAAYTGGGGGGGPTVTHLAADQTFTTTALADVTGLAVPVVAGTTTRFRFEVIFRTAATTTGIGLGLTYPAATVVAATVRIPFAADGAGGEFQGWITSSGDTVLSTGVQAANTDYLAVVTGIIRPSANGTVQLRARTEVAASAATVRLGSCVIV